MDEKQEESVIIELEKGKIEGRKQENVSRFLGVPYAHATEYFVPAKPVEAWEGIQKANRYGKISYQGTLFGMKGKNDEYNSNDCQNLNIWTPSISKTDRYPIMVWLHGGGFSTGSANDPAYDGAALANSQNVVVIGVNHRLNAFGFLNLSDFGPKYKNSANVGMMDIVEALRWIQKNGSCFGDDPNNITVFGESGGGCKALVLMASPCAKGWFHKAIVESGVTRQMGITLTSNELTRKIGMQTIKNLGLNKETIELIQTMLYTKILDAAYQARLKVGKQENMHLVLSEQYGIEWEASTGTE